MQGDLFVGSPVKTARIEPLRPFVHSREQWPPNYQAIYAWRTATLMRMRADPVFARDARAHYADNPRELIMDWMDTYNPRKTPRWVPFVLFERQGEFLDFVEGLIDDQESGLVEKCRDIGATWLLCALSVARFLFVRDEAIGWGSRKQELVDRLGDADSIFEKMRLLLSRLPVELMPDGWSARDHATFMKLVNPDNGATVTGESGDNIGRGGRKSIYFKDESAHYARPELIEASLGDNTNVQLDVSSVNGPGNVFHRRRLAGREWSPGAIIEQGLTRVFVFDWSHHPEKDQAWYDRRKAKAVREGMLHVFAQEVDRDYLSAMQNVVIPGEWVAACVDAHLLIPALQGPGNGQFGAALDVADEGIDRNALALREGVVLRECTQWGGMDPGETARKAFGAIKHRRGIKLQYDSIGIGSNVKSEFNRLTREGVIKPGDFTAVPWSAGAKVVDPRYRVIPDDDESPMNGAFFHNMKAQAWWSFRTRCYKTFRTVQAIRAGEPIPNYRPDELVSISSDIAELHTLKQELSQSTHGQSSQSLKMVINKKPDGSSSPNMADAVIMAYFPAPETGLSFSVGGT